MSLRSRIVDPDLVSRVEIADLLGVSQQRVHQLMQREDFPAPLVELAIGQIWRRSTIERWAKQTGRLDPGAD